MKKTRFGIIALGLATVLACAFSQRGMAADTSAATAPPAGFRALFNGTNLTGWWGAETEDPRSYIHLPSDQLEAKWRKSLENILQHWSVQNGELVNDGAGLYLTTADFFGNFELLLEYRTVPRADSGIYLRGCPQVQIWDSSGLWNNSTGKPGRDPLVKADKPFGEWNQLRVVMIGARVWVWLNGAQTVDGANLENYFDRSAPVPAKGPIQLQTHGGEIRWRNVFIREIASAEAISWLRPKSEPEFKPVFNGRDLDGWSGAVDGYEVQNGTLSCKAGKGGTLFTKEVFTNFVARLEFKLPAGGNNGLAIRYPGEGDPAYSGMCELQILDDNYERVTGRKLDPRQTHGSAYGIAAAARGYQFPAGEWNYEEVTVNGSQIKVELNGTVILDADLARVSEYMDRNAHPGKERPSGHFGFAGHNDPMAFRNISIRPLP